MPIIAVCWSFYLDFGCCCRLDIFPSCCWLSVPCGCDCWCWSWLFFSSFSRIQASTISALACIMACLADDRFVKLMGFLCSRVWPLAGAGCTALYARWTRQILRARIGLCGPSAGDVQKMGVPASFWWALSVLVMARQFYTCSLTKFERGRRFQRSK